MVTVDFIRFAAMFIIFATAWRLIQLQFPDSNVSKAMAFIL